MTPLAQAEARNYREPGGSYWGRTILGLPTFDTPLTRSFIRYWRRACYDNYRLEFFRSLSDLIPKIRENVSERWLIFVDSKAEGQRLAEALGGAASYIDAEKKCGEVWNELVDSQKFKCQVLVTTAVLDCGVNLVDSSLTNIAIISDDRTSLVQMLGRKRFQGKERANLWVCDLDNRTLALRNRRNTELLGWYQRYEECLSENRELQANRLWTFGKSLWKSGDTSLLKLFRLGKHRLFRNELALHKLKRQQVLYSRLADGTSFQDEVKSWLGKSLSSEPSPQARLDAFYDEHGEVPLDDYLQAELRKVIVSLREAMLGKEPQPTRVDVLQADALNNRLESLKSRYRIISDNHDKKSWILTKTEI